MSQFYLSNQVKIERKILVCLEMVGPIITTADDVIMKISFLNSEGTGHEQPE